MNENAFYVDPYGRYGKSSFIFDLIGLKPIAIGTIEQPVNQSICGIAIGQYAGYWNQGTCAIAIGEYAGNTSQGQESISIGVEAGKNNQGFYSISLGSEAGRDNQSSKSIAIGYLAAQNSQGSESVAIGSSAGFSNQGFQAIAIGSDAGLTNQSSYGIAIGSNAGQSNQGNYAIAIGYQAGNTQQWEKSIILNATGSSLNSITQGFYVAPIRSGSSGRVLYYNEITDEILSGGVPGGTIPGGSEHGDYLYWEKLSGSWFLGTSQINLGRFAGASNQATDGTALGFHAGEFNQSNCAIAIGPYAGQNSQLDNAVAIGCNSGNISQGTGAIAIGINAGQTEQSQTCVAIGESAGENMQNIAAVAIGSFAGQTNQGQEAVAIGPDAGGNYQGSYSIAIGTSAGYNTQGENSIAIGNQAGGENQQNFAIAIGFQTGSTNQGTNAIAIGQYAGQTNQPANSIVLNASGATMSGTTQSGFYVNPVRTGSSSMALFYDSTTREILQGSISANIIPDGINYSDYLFWNGSDWQVDGNRIHLGTNAGQTNQSSNSIAIGVLAGNISQGTNAIAIGQYAGQTNQPANSIVLNASGATMSGTTQSGFYVNPVRNITGPQALFYTPSTREITYSDPTFTNLSLQTYTYAYFQARDAVLGKFMLTDCADKDAFYRLRVSNPQTLYEGSTLYDPSPLLFDNDISSVNASITGPTNAYMTLSLNSSSVVNDYAARQTHFYAHYQPGKSFLALFSFCFGTFVSGITKRVGFYDVDNANSNNPLNGVLFEQTDTGVLRWLVYKGDGTFQVSNQSNWNVDPLNGTGQSGYILDTTKNLLGFVDLEWLGVGRVRTGFYINGVPIICNTFNNSLFDTPYINNPLLPIRYEIRKTVAGTSAGSMRTICCSIMSEGGFVPLGIVRSLRSNSLNLSGISPATSSIGSCIGIRLKSSCPRAILQPITVEIISDLQGNSVAYYSVYLWRPSSSATPSGLIWTSVATESLVEYNITAGGTPSISDLYRQMIADTTGISIQIEQGTVSTVTKTSFANIINNLLIAQSNVSKTNRDIILVVVDNTSAGPTGHSYSAIVTWKEL